MLYGHVFRNAMLIVIAGFPGAFVHAFFSGSLLIETIFSLDGIGLLGFESVLNRDYAVVFATLYIMSLVGLVVNLRLRPDLYLGRSAHRLRDPGGVRWTTEPPSTFPETTAQTPMGLGVPPERHRFAMSPLNRRRWLSFKANRRGYLAFWIFMVLFVAVAVRRVHRQRQAVLRALRRQDRFSRSFVTYPETAFGGDFETAADYRDPFLQKLIAEKGGFMLWPPIRYSYNTHNLDLPTPAPSKPTWMLDRGAVQGCRRTQRAPELPRPRIQLARHRRPGPRRGGPSDLWLSPLRAVRADAVTIISSVIGVAAGAVQGYFGGWTDLLFQRFIEIWTSVPSLYLLLIISSVLVPGFFVLLGILLLFSWVSLVGLVRAEFLRGRNFEYIQAARALGVSNRTIMFRHLLPNAMVATMTFLPFILSSVGDDADRARLPRLRPAAGLALARRDALARQGQHPGALARHLPAS